MVKGRHAIARGSRELSVQQARIFLGHDLQNLAIYSLVGLLVNKHLVVQWLASRRRDDASKRSPVRAPPSLTLEEFFCTDEESLVLTSHVITRLLTRTLDPVNSGKFARSLVRRAELTVLCDRWPTIWTHACER